MKHLYSILFESPFFPRFKTTVTHDLSLRDGSTVSTGTEVEVDFEAEGYKTVNVHYEGRLIRIEVSTAYRYLAGFQKPPRLRALQQELEQNDGKCSTPLGNLVDSKTHGPHGEPSWHLIYMDNKL